MTEWAITSTVLVAAVLALRAVLHKQINPRLQYAIWAVVALRLLVPVSLFSSPVSVMGALPDGFGRNPVVVLQPAETLPAAEVPDRAAESPTQPDQPGESNSPVQKDADSFAFKPNAEEILGMVWAAGALLAGAWFLGVNVHFYARLKRTRRVHTVDGCKLAVYQTAAVASPCLFGVVRPAIYLTPKAASNPDAQNHVMLHELCHFRQGDHIWSLLRGVCLAIWWWNPLVWAAAAVCRTDSELACDEAALRTLGEGARLEYGRTLVGMIAVSGVPSGLLCGATAMSAGKRGIKARLNRIVRQPKRYLPAGVAAAVCAALFAGCAFAGPVQSAPGPNSMPEQPEPVEGNVRITNRREEPVYRIVWEEVGGNGGQHSFDPPRQKGESAQLALTGSMGYTIWIYGKDDRLLGKASFADDFASGARADLELSLSAEEDLLTRARQFERTYGFTHAQGNTRFSLSNLEGTGEDLAHNILCDYVVKSAAFPGVDVSALPEYYILHQSFPGETREYYAFQVADGPVTGAVLQNGANGMYSRISDELYQALVDFMQKELDDPTPVVDYPGIQARKLERHLADFAELPRGEDLRQTDYSGDWDGDGKEDRAFLNTDARQNRVTVELGNGETITADSIALESISSWGGRFLIEAADLTGDGQNEIILLLDLGAQGGRGSFALYPYTRTQAGWELMDAPRYGFSATLSYQDHRVIVTSGEYAKIVADNAMMAAHYAAAGSEELWAEIKSRGTYYSEKAADLISDIAVTEHYGQPVVKISQYLTGLSGSHADQFGYLVTTLSWDETGAYSILDTDALVWPQ